MKQKDLIPPVSAEAQRQLILTHEPNGPAESPSDPFPRTRADVARRCRRFLGSEAVKTLVYVAAAKESHFEELLFAALTDPKAGTPLLHIPDFRLDIMFPDGRIHYKRSALEGDRAAAKFWRDAELLEFRTAEKPIDQRWEALDYLGVLALFQVPPRSREDLLSVAELLPEIFEYRSLIGWAEKLSNRGLSFTEISERILRMIIFLERQPDIPGIYSLGLFQSYQIYWNMVTGNKAMTRDNSPAL